MNTQRWNHLRGMARSKREIISNFSGFVVSRGLGTVVDTLVLWFCEKLIFKGYWGEYIISPAISFEVATLFNFVLSYYWIWKSRVENKSAKVFWHLFWIFNLSCVAGFFVKMVFLLLFERLFGFDAVICNLLALCISGIFNFYLAEWMVFKKKKLELAHPLLTPRQLSKLSPLFSGVSGRLLASGLIHIFGVAKMNRCYDSVYPYKGVDCASKLIDKLGCNYLLGNPDKMSNLPEGAFITISNHPYGGVDALILAELFGSKRGDYKIMSNSITSKVENLSDLFIKVTPTTTKKKAPDAVTIRGIRDTLSQIMEGHPLGCFPSGAVSDFDLKTWSIQDRNWQTSMLRIIKRSKVPVVPVHFLNGNSVFYYILGLISWKIRVLRLPHEYFNKNKGKHHLVIGDVISVEEQDKYTDLEEYGRMLRSRVYDMPVPDTYTSRSMYIASESKSLSNEKES